ncbi:MAG: ATP-grasp domain-containing protein [Burkholderiales bacterium]
MAPDDISVLIPDGEHDASFKVLTCLAQAPKVRIHVISSKARTRVRYSRFCSSFSLRTRASEEDWFNQIRDVARQKRVNVILPVYSEAVRFVSAGRDRLSELAALPLLPDTRTFDVAVDKGSLARFLNEHDLPTPRTVPLARALEAGITLPLLVKPRRLTGGLGIEYCQNERSLKKILSAKGATVEEYIAQELVEGRDLSCSVLCRDGEILAHTIHQRTIPAPRPFATSFCIRLLDCPPAFEVVRGLMSALNWSGIANVGIKFDERTPRILDFNPRFWGNLMGSMAAGVNFPYLCCLTALKRPLPERQYRLQEYMELQHALNRIARKLKGYGDVIPNLLRETNLRFILRDPLPFLNRKCER